MKRSGLTILLAFLLGSVLYANTFEAGFYFDSLKGIQDNIHIRSPLNLRSLWQHYPIRFFTYLSFALNYHFGKLEVFGYHVVNVTIHVLNGFLVWGLAYLTLKTPAMAGAGGLARHKEWIALASALLFVAHPIQTQAVTYIVQRYTSLATLFYLLSLVMYLQARLLNQRRETSGPRRVPSGLCYLVALLSAVLAMITKEISFTLPVILVLYELLFWGSFLRKSRAVDWKRLAGLVPFLGTLAIIPWALLREADKSPGDMIGGLGALSQETEAISRGDYLLTQFRVLVTYLRLLFLPVNQNLDYDYPISRSFDFPVVFSLLLLSLILGMAVYLLSLSRQPGRSGLRVLAFGVFWFFITLSVESSVIPIRDVIYEHRLYLPSVGVVLSFVGGVFYLFDYLKWKWTTPKQKKR